MADTQVFFSTRIDHPLAADVEQEAVSKFGVMPKQFLIRFLLELRYFLSARLAKQPVAVDSAISTAISHEQFRESFLLAWSRVVARSKSCQCHAGLDLGVEIMDFRSRVRTDISNPDENIVTKNFGFDCYAAEARQLKQKADLLCSGCEFRSMANRVFEEHADELPPGI